MKQLLFLLLFPCLALAQYQGNGNQKITLGEQTTADGLVWRGIRADTTSKIVPFSDTSAYIILDTVEKTLWLYKAGQIPKWQQVGGSAGGSTFDTATLNLVSRFALKLNISDTAAMLSNYNSRINLKVNISDTTNMLNPYFRDADTTSLNLTTRFAAKQNNLTLTTTGTSGAATLSNDTLNIPQYSGGGGSTLDTATMLLPYYRAGRNGIIQVADVPTLNQNTTGSAATLTTARNIRINLASAYGANFNGSADITPGVSGVLGAGNGGTGASNFGSPNRIPFVSSSGSLTTDTFFAYNGTTQRLGVGVPDPTEKLHVSGNARITGNISVGSATPTTSGTGITFPATQLSSTNANTFDDYEEGTWTPVVNGYISNPTMSYLFQFGTYTKVGRLVVFELLVRGQRVSGGSGRIYIKGLPYASADIYGYASSVNNSNVPNTLPFVGIVMALDTGITYYTNTFANTDVTNWCSDCFIYCSGYYHTN